LILGNSEVDDLLETVMFDIDSDLIEKIALGELITIVIFGFLYCTFIKHKYKNAESFRIFRYGEYTSQIIEDPKVVFQIAPKWFRFVVVQYGGSGQVVSESFYTFLGDVTTIKFEDGKFSGGDSNPYSNLVFIAAALIGVVLLSPNFILENPILSSLFSGFVGVLQKSSKYGATIFCSVFLSAPIKIIFDFATQWKMPTQQENSR
jgi:hypothetical protein